MVFIRATKKVLAHLPPPSEDVGDADDTALGDWYVNRVVVDRKPLLVLVSAQSLLPILAPARDVRHLPDRLAEMVGERLIRLGVDSGLIRAEVSAVAPVHVAPTTDRSVLGIVTEFCGALPYYLDYKHWGVAELCEAERKLTDTPCFVSSRRRHTIFPDRESVELLRRRWLPGHGGSSGDRWL